MRKKQLARLDSIRSAQVKPKNICVDKKQLARLYSIRSAQVKPKNICVMPFGKEISARRVSTMYSGQIYLTRKLGREAIPPKKEQHEYGQSLRQYAQA